MSTLDLKAVRQRVAAAISGAMTAGGWREAKEPYDQFGASDGEGRFHKSYAVGVPSTAPMGDRQRASLGVMVETQVRVRWAYKLGAQRQVTDYDAGLDVESDIRAAVATVAQSTDLHLLLRPSSRSSDDQGWMTGEMEWVAIHRLPLT